MATDSGASVTAPLPPGPGGLPVLGNTHQLARGTLSFYERVTAEYGDLVRIEVAGDEIVIVAHPEHVQRILVADDDRYVKGSMLNDRLGTVFENGMFLAEGEAWRRQREAAQPAFYRERILEYADVVAAPRARDAVCAVSLRTGHAGPRVRPVGEPASGLAGRRARRGTMTGPGRRGHRHRFSHPPRSSRSPATVDP